MIIPTTTTTTTRCIQCNKIFQISSQRKKLCSDSCVKIWKRVDAKMYRQLPRVKKFYRQYDKKYKAKQKILSERYRTESYPTESFTEFVRRTKKQ